MQTLGSDDEVMDEIHVKFWRRQFQPEATRGQRRFDWIFGVILPVACFAFDPIVFRGSLIGGGAAFGEYKPFAYLLSFVSIMSLMAWLIWGRKLGWLNAILSGLFFVSGIVSFVVGVFLLPYSIFGLIILIGALGFTPLFTSIVYVRNALRVFEAAELLEDDHLLLRSFFLGAIISFSVPYVVNSEVNHLITEIVSGDPATARQSAMKLRYVAPIACFDKLVFRYRHASNEEKDSLRMQTMAGIYQDLTGESIEYRGILAD